MSGILDDATRRDWVVEQIRAGRSEADIAEQLAVTRMTINRAKKKHPKFGLDCETARLAARGEQRAVEQLDRVRARKTGADKPAKPKRASATQATPTDAPREVVEGELVEPRQPARAGCCPSCGFALDIAAVFPVTAPGDRAEFLQILWTDLRDHEAPQHGRALDIAARYYLAGEMLRERLDIERVIAKLGDTGDRPKVIVLQLPSASGGEAGG